MPARVQVIVEAKDTASGILRGISSQFGALGSTIEELTGKNVSWGNLAAQATDLVVTGLKQSIKATQEYASEVRDLSLASGASAEESSRLLQVLDDFEISAQDVTAATKALTKNGLSPTVSTIADLADKYVTLNTAQEKNQFIIDNLGRGGLKWANALSKGGDALRELNDTVNTNLILNEDNIRQAEEYRLALDSWNDSVMALQVAIGTNLIPVLTDLSNAAAENATEFNNNKEQMNGFVLFLNYPISTLLSLEKRTDAVSIKQQDLALAFDQSGQAAAEAATDYGKLLSTAEKINDATREQISLTAYQDLKTKLSEGGITEDEASLLENAGISLGIFDKEAANAARSIEDLNSKLTAGQIPLWKYIDLLNSIPTQIETTVTVNQEGEYGREARDEASYASGGTVYAGQPINVGENGIERFIPSQNGRVLGHAESLHAAGLGGGGGTNYFYGNVTLSVGQNDADSLLGYR